MARVGSITEVYDKRLVYLFENLLDLEAPIGATSPEALPLLHETLYRRLLIFSLWAMRHEKEAPGLLAALRPYTRRLRGLRYPAAPWRALPSYALPHRSSTLPRYEALYSCS